MKGRPMATARVTSHLRLLMPRELLAEPGVHDARGLAVDRVHWNALLASDTAGTRQRVVPVTLEPHEDVDTAADDAPPSVVREAETVVDLSGPVASVAITE